ncbi:MAG: phosphoribosylaminoimidazolesuccinocarboxamide synthase [Cytophagales bacterium]|nr:phosphoribosylaminoimidazolesuccinocarboxamide synthase [Cytophagales bacterium]
MSVRSPSTFDPNLLIEPYELGTTGESGKIRNIYQGTGLLIQTTDKISVGDQVLPVEIPHKGEILNELMIFFFDRLENIPHWKPRRISPTYVEGINARPIRLEVIVRGYLSGHAWRLYQNGIRNMGGSEIPEGLKEYDPLPKPIITPTTKEADKDQDIEELEIIQKGLATEKEYDKIKSYALEIYRQGSEYAQSRKLILLDSKYEFGRDKKGKIILIDELHTPDSSRYLGKGKDGKWIHLSKEYVRRRVRSMGKNPSYTRAWIEEVSKHYKKVYQHLMGRAFEPSEELNFHGS